MNRDTWAALSGRPVFSERGREAPKQSQALHGSMARVWTMAVSSLVDYFFSLVGGLLALYLVLFSLFVLLDLAGAVGAGDYSPAYPFWAVTLARFAKSACNFVTKPRHRESSKCAATRVSKGESFKASRTSGSNRSGKSS